MVYSRVIGLWISYMSISMSKDPLKIPNPIWLSRACRVSAIVLFDKSFYHHALRKYGIENLWEKPAIKCKFLCLDLRRPKSPWFLGIVVVFHLRYYIFLFKKWFLTQNLFRFHQSYYRFSIGNWNIALCSWIALRF